MLFLFKKFLTMLVMVVHDLISGDVELTSGALEAYPEHF